MDIAIKIDGMRELQTYLGNTAPDAIKQGIIDTLTDLAFDIYNTTTSLCPIDTGYLLKSIDVNTAYDTLTAVAGADYASYVDEGTSKMDAQPFFQEPIDDILKDFEDKLSKQIDDNLEKADR